MADALASIVADAVLTVRREGEPIDLHMVEVRREERRGGKK
jgi:T-complex protein 1 subunit zeta